jgi:hypothetical protein
MRGGSVKLKGVMLRTLCRLAALYIVRRTRSSVSQRSRRKILKRHRLIPCRFLDFEGKNSNYSCKTSLTKGCKREHKRGSDWLRPRLQEPQKRWNPDKGERVRIPPPPCQLRNLGFQLGWQRLSGRVNIAPTGPVREKKRFDHERDRE